MFDYQKAPYLELEDYKAPNGVKCVFIPMNDKKKIRLAYWKYDEKKSEARGTILLQQGHNEFIEKYYETIQELIVRRFNVVCFDWRGQGMSDRRDNNVHRQYIKDFSLHDGDLKFIVQEVIKDNFTEPLIGFGHSMGGCLLLSSLPELQKNFKAVILSAPMLGFRNEKVLSILLNLVNLLMPSKSYFPASKPNMGKETPFEDNDLTSDIKRYYRTQSLVRKQPSIRLWGITNAWIKAVNKRLKKIRKKGWAENIKNNILIINSIKDRVVSSDRIIEMHQRLPKSEIVNFKYAKHEVLMENDKNRKIFWENLDNFLEKIL